MFRSTTAPVSRFLNLVRVNAAPLPGLTNWNSTMVYGFPSIKTLRPLRISDVSYMARRLYPSRSGLSTRPFSVGTRRVRHRGGRGSGQLQAARGEVGEGGRDVLPESLGGGPVDAGAPVPAGPTRGTAGAGAG